LLILQRRVGEKIVIGGEIEITIAEITKRGVRLAVRAPRGVTVLRGETHDAIVASNALAAQTVGSEFDVDVDVDGSAVAPVEPPEKQP